MKTLVLTLTTLITLSGCSQKAHECPPQKPCLFPLFKTYKSPPKNPNKMTKPILLKDGTCIVVYSEFIDLYKNKEYYKAQMGRCNKTLIKSNDTYHKDKVNDK